MTRNPQADSLPIKFKECIKANAQDFTNRVTHRPLEKFTKRENVLMRTIDVSSNSSQPITYENFIEEREVFGSFSKTCEHVCVIGSRGCGKTTVLSRFVEEAHAQRIPQLVKGHILHVVNCHHFDPNYEITVFDFLFDELDDAPSLGEMRDGFTWMQNYPTKITFLVDSLESLPYAIKGDKIIGLSDRATPGTILHNLIEGNLFLGCGVVTSCETSKYEKYSESDNKLPIEKVILISGFSPTSINRIATKCLGEESFNQAFVFLKDVAPYLMTLCEHPTLFILILASLKNCDDPDFLPKTMSGVIIKLLSRIIEKSPGSGVIVTIEKLKLLAFQLKRQNKMHISSEHLKTTGLTKDDLLNNSFVLDGVPLITETFNYASDEMCLNFLHPVLLDSLFGLFIAEVDFERFKINVEKFLSNSKYSNISRYVGGFLLDDKVFEESLNCYSTNSMRITQLRNDRDRKCTFMKHRIASWLKEIEDMFALSEQLNLLHAICECGRDIKPTVYLNIDNFIMSRFGFLLLTSADMCALATVICYRVELDHLTLSNCPLPPSLLNTFQRCMRTINKYGKVRNFALNMEDGEKVATEEDLHSITGLLICTTDLMDLQGWKFDKNGILVLQKMLNDLQRYSLRIQTSHDKFLVAQSTWYDVTQKELTAEGGNFALHDFDFKFPEGSLKKKTKVVLEMTNQAPQYPDEYLVMSSTVNVSIYADLCKPLDINVNPWVCKDDEINDEVIVEILRLEDGCDTWTTVKSMPFTNEKTVQFQCQSFSSIALAIKNFFAPKVILPISGTVCAKGNLWCLWFYFSNKSSIAEADETIKREGYRRLSLPFNIIFAKFGDEIEVKMHIKKPYTDDFVFQTRRGLKFTLTRQMARHHGLPHLTFKLEHDGPIRKSCVLEVEYDTFCNKIMSPENGYGDFEYEVQATFERGMVVPKKRLEDVLVEIQSRFSSGCFKKFAMSSEGLGLSLTDIDEIEEDYRKTNDRTKEMVMTWKNRGGPNADGDKLSRMIERYFDMNPTSDNGERICLDRVCEEAASKYSAYQQWIDFTSSTHGLSLPEDIVEEFVGNQENITKKQRLQMLKHWTETQGDSVSASMLQGIMDNYDRNNS